MSEVAVDIPTFFFEGSTGYCLVRALSTRGIAYRFLSPDEITKAKFAHRTIVTFDINGVRYYFEGGRLRISDPLCVNVPGPMIDDPIVRRLIKRKDSINSFLRDHGFSVPEGAAFPREAQGEAESFFVAISSSLSGGVCVKPTDGRLGDQVHLGIGNLDSFRAAFAAVARHYDRVLIEEFVTGAVYRFFCLAGRVVAVRLGLPANVEGDGLHSIAELIDIKNVDRQRNPCHRRVTLRLGQSELELLKTTGLRGDSVPKGGQIVWLDARTNLHQGADIVDATDEVHPSYVELVEETMRLLPGLIVCGADVAIEDPSTPPTHNGYHVIELNSGPGFSSHHYPWRGEPRDVAGAIVGYLAASTPSRPTAPVEKIG